VSERLSLKFEAIFLACRHERWIKGWVHARMTFLPIVQRELIEASRRRGTYWIRVGAAAAGLIIGVWVMAFPEFRVPSRIGMALFVPLSIIALLYCSFIGIFRTADCLSEEKREGTLGLLFLTDLKGYDIVVGKLAATSLNAAYGLLALFPVMAIPLLAGGVTIAEFGRVVLVCLNTLFFTLAVGMFSSAINRDERRAMVFAFGIVLFLVVGVPIIAAVVGQSTRWRNSGMAEWLAVPSPSFSAVFAFEDTRRGVRFGSSYFVVSVVVIHVMAWLFLLASSLIVPRTWQDRPLSAAALRRRHKLEHLGAGPVSRRVARRQWLIAINPILWLVTRQRFKTVGLWSLLAGGALAWIIGLIKNPGDWKEEFAYILTAIAAHTILKFAVVTEACRRFSLDRQSGALELLLSTPLPAREIVRGQVLGLERLFAGPALVILVADFVFLLAERQNEGWIAMWAVGMIVFVADLFTLSWLGMWRGLNSRRPNRAAAAALLRIQLLPWILIAVFLTLVALSRSRAFDHHFWESNGLQLLYLMVSLGVNAIFGLPARNRLLTEFREVATQRFESKPRK
jgi:ABC-type transport system involved in multi-copper enzyme maturation permease subunit